MGEFLLRTHGSLDCTYSLFKVLYSVWPYGIRNDFSYTVSISHRTAGVSIWTTDNVVVGTASAAVNDYGGELQFLRNGNLLLINGSGATVWTSNTAQPWCASASLDDTGNLVLTTGSINAWSSFENPADTLVPSQSLTVNQTLRSGVYSFRLLSNGNMSLTWNDSVVYWNRRLSSASELKLTSPNLQLQSNGILTLLDASLRMSCYTLNYKYL